MRRDFFACLAIFTLALAAFGQNATNSGVHEANLALSSLLYDPFTAKLYAGSGNNLLQIDPETGEVLRSFPIGNSVYRLSLGAENAIWVGLDVESAVCRFDLGTFSAGPKIPIPGGPLFDIAASPSDSYSAAVSTGARVGKDPVSFVIKNGALLPDGRTTMFSGYLAMQGDFVYIAWPDFSLGQMRAGPNGFLQEGTIPTGGTGGGGRIKIAGTTIFHATGATLDIPSLAGRFSFNPADRTWNSIALNTEAGLVYFLSAYDFSPADRTWVLDRFDLETSKLTARYFFPKLAEVPQPREADLTAWSTNRLAFHASSKLYLLQSDQLFVTPDLTVEQTPASGDFVYGTAARIQITVRNNTAGTALEVVLTNTVSSAIILGTNAVNPAKNQLVLPLGFLRPFSSTNITIDLLPSAPGIVTNTVQVADQSDLRIENNISAIQIFVHADPLPLRLPLSALDMAFDAKTGKLLVLENTGNLWSIDPLNTHLGLPVSLPVSALASSDSGFVYGVSTGGTVLRIDSQTLAAAPAIRGLGSSIVALDVSPANSNLLAIGDETGTHLYTNGTRLPAGLPLAGNLRFSRDGSELIFVNPTTCFLEIYSVTQNGLAPESNGAGAICSSFHVSNGSIYFDNGSIFDAHTGQKTGSALKLTPPSLVLPRTNGIIDAVTRTNNIWTLERLSPGTFLPLRSVAIPNFDGAPLKIVAMGPDAVALRTTTSALYIASFAVPQTAGLAIGIAAAGLVNLDFETETGASYSIESAAEISSESWETVRGPIPGTGERVSFQLSATNSAAFYRVLKVP